MRGEGWAHCIPACRGTRRDLAASATQNPVGVNTAGWSRPDDNRPLRDDCLDHRTGELSPLAIVSDNGPAYKSVEFIRFIAGRPELVHVRTRHRAPETNGVVERFFGTLKYEHLYRIEIGDVLELQAEVDAFRQLYNTWRPHETLGQTPPIGHYLAEPNPERNLSEPGSLQES